MSGITRREAMAGAAAAATATLAAGSVAAEQDKMVVKKGRIKQGVARWCFNMIKLPELCKAAAEMGLKGIDILGPKDWKIAADHGLVVSAGRLGASGKKSRGLNEKKRHDAIVKDLEDGIPKAKAAGVPNLLCFFGNRRGMEDQEGIDNSVECLNRVKSLLEENGVTVIIELLNSKLNQKDYIGDNTPYCVGVVKGVNSPNVKVLYDIYHAQIMEGDVIRTIQDNHQWFGHYHTAGVPGRNDLDEHQELYYPAITRAVIDTGFKGFYAHEFRPKDTKNPLKALRAAVALCDV